MQLKVKGMSNTDIAAEMDLGRQWVSQLVNHELRPHIDAARAELKAQSWDLLVSGSTTAVSVLIDIARDDSAAESDRIRASETVLKYVHAQKHEHDHTLSDDDLRRMLRGMSDAELAGGGE